MAAGDAIQPFNFITNSVGATATAGSNFADTTRRIVTTIGRLLWRRFACCDVVLLVQSPPP